MGKTLTNAPRSGDCIQRVISGESLTGTVLGMAHTEVNPPAAAAAVPVAMVSLCGLAGLAQMHMQIDEAGSDDAAPGVEGASGLTAQLAGRSHGGHAAVAQQHVHILIDAAGGIDDAPAY